MNPENRGSDKNAGPLPTFTGFSPALKLYKVSDAKSVQNAVMTNG